MESYLNAARRFIAIGVALALAGCVAEQGQIATLDPQQAAAIYPQTDHAAACLIEVNAPGAYVSRGNSAVPTVVAGGGGTKAGADAINACIRRKAAENKGTSGLPDVAGVPQKVETRTDGDRRTETFTYGSPPTANSTPANGASYNEPRTGACALRMTGGTGYTCVGTGW